MKDPANFPETFQAEEAESGIVSAILHDPAQVNRVRDFVTGSDFIDHALGKTFDLLVDMNEAKMPIGDIPFVCGKFRDAGLFGSLGGAKGIAKLASAGLPSHAVHYAMEIRNASHRRKIADMAKEMFSRIESLEESPRSVVDWFNAKAEAAVTDVTEDVSTLSDSVRMVADRAEKASRVKYQVGVQTGFRSIDETTGGIFGNELIVLAARPSVGKTAFATNVLMNAATAGRKCLMVSLEMKQWEIAQRLVSAEMDIENNHIRQGLVSEDEILNMRVLAEDWENHHLQIWDPSTAKISQIVSKARVLKAMVGLDILCVDYIGLVDMGQRNATRAEQVSEAARAFKGLAGELDIPVIVLAQINRQGEGVRPSLSQLKESGGLEEHANTVWLLHRAERDSTEAEINIAKSRNSAVGMLKLIYQCDKAKFLDDPGNSDTTF